MRRGSLKPFLAEVRPAAMAGRSWASLYEWQHANLIALAAHDAGLIDVNDDFRDRETGRRMKTVFRELGRLKWDLARADWQAWLAENWPHLRTADLATVKAWVREQRSSKFERTTEAG
ncbi:MAG: hypothetical protein HY690_15370 [Chloroflexi bacterium]|nr:hypothetical protein [Chloroflexota bacterium]